MALKTPLLNDRDKGPHRGGLRRMLRPILSYTVWTPIKRGKHKGEHREVWVDRPYPEPREQFARDRSLRGKDRIRARREENRVRS